MLQIAQNSLCPKKECEIGACPIFQVGCLETIVGDFWDSERFFVVGSRETWIFGIVKGFLVVGSRETWIEGLVGFLRPFIR